MVADIYQDATGVLYQVITYCAEDTETGDEEIVIYKTMIGKYYTATREKFTEKGMKFLGSINLY